MARATNAFADEEPSGVQRGRGGFMRGGDSDSPYVTDPTGALVKTGPRKGQPKRIPYGSPSGAGKLIENTYNLQKWGERRVVLGIGTDLALIADCAKLTTLDVDSDEYKELADRIVVAAKDAAKTMLAAEQGTHDHAILEDDDEGRNWLDRAAAGELLGIPAEAQRTMVDAWRKMLVDHGLEVLATEASCVDDVWNLAGTLDNLARCTRSLRFRLCTGEVRTIPAGTVVVLDKKTGQMRTKTRSGAIEYWHGYAVQVASYAQSKPYDTETETRGEWEWPISQEHALIAHIDNRAAIAGAPVEDIITLVYVDLVAGREHGGATVVQAKEWSKRDDIFSVGQLLEGGAAEPPDVTTAASLATSPAAPIDTALPAVPTPPEPAAPATAPEAAPSPLRAAQLERAATIADHTAELPARPDEGADLSADTYASMWDVMRQRYTALDRPALDWVGGLIKQARDAGVSFQAQAAHTARRSHIYRGLIALAGHEPSDDALRALVRLALDSDAPLFPTVTAGHALGSLDAVQAERFADLVDAYLVPDQETFRGEFIDGDVFVLTPLAAAAA